jgi:hypothetical protein
MSADVALIVKHLRYFLLIVNAQVEASGKISKFKLMWHLLSNF